MASSDSNDKRAFRERLIAGGVSPESASTLASRTRQGGAAGHPASTRARSSTGNAVRTGSEGANVRMPSTPADTPVPPMKKRSKAPSTPKQGDLFVCEITNWPVKDDLASMEVPLFSLSKNKDLVTRLYRKGNKSIRIIPSTAGAATVFDKDLLLYIASQLVEQLNRNRDRGEDKPISRTVQVESHDFLVGTERGDGRASFERILGMLRRLKGTTIETTIPTGGEIPVKGFSLIDDYEVILGQTRVELTSDGSGKTAELSVLRAMRFSVTISDWLYKGLMAFEVLTLDRGYFKLSKPIERRLYEIGRKHCGDQPMWKINIDALAEKIGIRGARFKVRDEIRQAIAGDRLPEYKLALDSHARPDDVVFYTRDSGKLSRELVRTGLYDWFSTLERTDNSTKKPAIADV